jgi:hypothetical protein
MVPEIWPLAFAVTVMSVCVADLVPGLSVTTPLSAVVVQGAPWPTQTMLDVS